jgi:hypothetical protein
LSSARCLAKPRDLAAMKGRCGASSQVAKNCPIVTKRRQSGGRAAGTEK